MTQTSFLSAAELNITEAERTALIKLMGHFRTERAPPNVPREVSHDIGQFYVEPGAAFSPLGFSMSVSAYRVKIPGYDCGSVGCIGGHVSLMLDGYDVTEVEVVPMTQDMVDRAGEYVSRPKHGTPLEQLFYPPEEDVREGTWARITPLTASFAIENLLTRGRANWTDALERGDQSHLSAHHDDV